MHEHGIRPVIVPRMHGGLKDPGDLEMALDAAEVCLRARSGTPPGVVIASEDADFAIVLRRIRSWGSLAVAAVGQAPLGGKASSHDLFREASGSDLVHYTVGVQDTGKCVVVDLDDLSSGVDVVEGGPVEPLSEQETGALVEVLEEHGYQPRRLLPPAIARFFHVNQLGALCVWPVPRMLRDAHTSIVLSGSQSWLPDPGDLVYVQPMGSAGGKSRTGSAHFNQSVRGGGPFLCRAGPDLVDSVLRRLGYIDRELCAEGLQLFCEFNRKALQTRGVQEDADTLDVLRQKLDAVFRDQDVLQRWKVPPRDRGVRERLAGRGLLPSADCSREELRDAMRDFLRASDGDAEPPSTHAGLVARCARHFHRDDPSNRRGGFQR